MSSFVFDSVLASVKSNATDPELWSMATEFVVPEVVSETLCAVAAIALGIVVFHRLQLYPVPPSQSKRTRNRRKRGSKHGAPTAPTAPAPHAASSPRQASGAGLAAVRSPHCGARAAWEATDPSQRSPSAIPQQQYHDAVLSCTTPRQVLSLFDSCGDGQPPVNLSVTLNRISKLARPARHKRWEVPPPAVAELLEDAAWRRLLARLHTAAPSLSCRSASSTLWAFGNINVQVPESLALRLFQRVERILPSMKFTDLCHTCWGVAVLGMQAPPGLVSRMFSRAAEGQAAATPREIALMLWSVGKLSPRESDAVMLPLLRAVVRTASQFGVMDLMHITWALPHLPTRLQEAEAVVRGRAKVLAPQLLAGHVACVAFGVGRLGTLDSELAAVLRENVTTEQLSGTQREHLSWGLAVLEGRSDQPLLYRPSLPMPPMEAALEL